MATTEEINRIDDLRRRGEVSWEEYGRLLKAAWATHPADLFKAFATGQRDRDGRLRVLKDLGNVAAKGGSA